MCPWSPQRWEARPRLPGTTRPSSPCPPTPGPSASPRSLARSPGGPLSGGDVAALAEVLIEGADPHHRKDWGAAGQRRVVERFSLERMLDDYRRLLFTAYPSPGPSGSTINQQSDMVVTLRRKSHCGHS